MIVDSREMTDEEKLERNCTSENVFQRIEKHWKSIKG